MITPTQLIGAAAVFASVSDALVTGIKPYQQQALDMFNILKHQGGQGPYSTHPGYGIERDVPEQCTIEQAQMFMRHGERYPAKSLGTSLTKFFAQIKDKNLTAKNDLYWLNDYSSPALDAEFFEAESTEGFYNGYASMYQAGAEIRARYGHLWQDNVTLPFFTAAQERIVVSAVNVARGFFGANWTDNSEFVVLNETENMGLNSLTPVEGCPAFNGSYKEDYSAKWAEIGLERALNKFKKNLPGINATTSDIANVMSLCMYDLNVIGSSPWCEYFSADDWVAFDYYHMLDYYYYCGNGNPTIPAVGSVVANASLHILDSPASAANGTALYMSFMHEVNILMLLTAFGIVNPASDLQYNQPEFTSRWRTSQLVPMGTRVVLERLSCANTTDPEVTEDYVRFIINDAVIPHDTCTSGPGFSCPIDDFIAITKNRLQDPVAKCGINSTYEYQTDLSFYWDWQSKLDTEYNNYVVDVNDF